MAWLRHWSAFLLTVIIVPGLALLFVEITKQFGYLLTVALTTTIVVILIVLLYQAKQSNYFKDSSSTVLVLLLVLAAVVVLLAVVSSGDMMIISIFREHLRDTGIAKEDTNNLSTSKCWNQVVTIWKEKASPTIDLSDSIAMFDSYVTTNLTCVTKKNEMYLSMLEKLRQTANEYQQKIFQTIYFDLLFGHLAKTGEECFITFCNIFLQNPGYTETGLELCKSCKACCLDGLNGTWFHVTESCSVPSAFALSSPVDSSLSKVRKNTAVFVLKGIGCNEWFEIKEDEIRIETALAFPKNHKKIIPVYYGILVDDCRKRDREFYCHLTKIGGYHKRVESDEQFATRIAENVMRLAWDQHQSSNLFLFLFV